MTPAELIAKLEEASEGSRELDGDIAETLGIAADATSFAFGMTRNKNHKGYLPVDRGEWSRSTPTNESWRAPNYTTSVDAALMLVPAGYRYLIDRRPNASDRVDGYRAHVWLDPMVSYEHTETWSVSPALALTIAALKARQATEDA